MLLPSFILTILAAQGKDLSGPLDYTRTGVRYDGRTVSWRSIRLLNETVPDVEALRAEAGRQRRTRVSSASALADLGAWCRERHLHDLASACFNEALELDPSHAASRRGAGFAREQDSWIPAASLLPKKLEGVGPRDVKRRLEIAAWCGKHSLRKEELAILTDLAILDGRNRDVIRRLRELTRTRQPRTELAPPLRGLWQALEDRTKHHQAKIWAVTAIDFVRVDEKGKLFRNSGRALSDHYGFGSPVHATADGVVTRAEGRFDDLIPPRLGSYDKTNGVTIRHASGEHTNYAHLKKDSVTVKAGDSVKKGQLIGRVGNSGRSGMPHLHFTMMAPLRGSSGASWIGVPYAFTNFRLIRAGRTNCDIDVKRARPQEGWTMVFPEP